MARGFKRRDGRYAAKLDAVERGLVVGLMEQVLELIAPGGGQGAESGDEFDEIVSDLGGIGTGVPLSGADQSPGPAGAQAQERDPALDRIFPTANRQDEELAAEFRRLTEDGLRSRKAANLTTAIEALSDGDDQKISLDHGQALALLVALTDVRLVLGERLGLEHDDDLDRLQEQSRGRPDDDPTVYAIAVYDFLTWLQETLAHALTP